MFTKEECPEESKSKKLIDEFDLLMDEDIELSFSRLEELCQKYGFENPLRFILNFYGVYSNSMSQHSNKYSGEIMNKYSDEEIRLIGKMLTDRFKTEFSITEILLDTALSIASMNSPDQKIVNESEKENTYDNVINLMDYRKNKNDETAFKKLVHYNNKKTQLSNLIFQEIISITELIENINELTEEIDNKEITDKTIESKGAVLEYITKLRELKKVVENKK